MKTFLEETAKAIIRQKQNFKNMTCVVPSERSGIYLKNCFKKELSNQVSFLPKIISIESFIKDMSGLESMDQVSLVFEFFNVYNEEFKGVEKDTFERFIGWATIVIQDFNEIDRHLVNSKELFSYVTDLQNIKDWTPERETETDTVKNYMSFVEDLEMYYRKLRSVLLEKKAGYQGLIYREAYLNHKDYLRKNEDTSFHFIGFNALNKAEEEIFKSFLSVNKNQIHWDVDTYYLNDNHEAGHFIRKFFSEWECLQIEGRKNFVNSNFQKKKNIQILGTPLNVTGIKAATSVLVNEIDPKETAFVLAEETILPVVLNSLPRSVKEVNITMGYALSNIPLAGLFQSLFDLHLNKQKLGKKAFYYKDVLSFFRHPYLNKITENRNIKLVETITKNNLVFITEDTIAKLCKECQISLFVSDLFGDFSKVLNLLSVIIDFINHLNSRLEGVELLYVEGYRKVFQEIHNLNNKYNSISTIKVLYKIFKKLLPLETVDFRGEALEGMQLMGVLETRCLDFKNVILTSVNEGVLPSGKTERSFISFEVKKHFKMPTYLAKDAIFSYHFYRLIQRAENIYLLYNTKQDDFGGGEMSRFLTQLLMDKEAEITHRNVLAPVYNRKPIVREVEKIPRVMELLKAYFKKGASPSRIIEYVNDPLSFYQKIVLKIKETDTVEEEVAHNTLGTVVHDSLEFLYKPFVNKILISEDIKMMKSQSKKMVASKFKQYFKEGDTTTGKNRLINEVANQFVLNFLNKELEEIQSGKEIVVKELEGEYSLLLETPKGHKIALRGKIDRVDEVDGVRRIVDYKTGKVEVKDLKLSDLSLVTTDYKYHKILQVMTYVLLYSEANNFDLDKSVLETGIYSFKNLKAGFLAMNFSENPRKKECNVTTEYLRDFKEALFVLLDEILDDKIAFVENVDKKYKKEI